MKYSLVNRINACTLAQSLADNDDFWGSELENSLQEIIFCDFEQTNSIINEDDERFLLKATNSEAYEHFLVTIVERLHTK